MIKQELDCSISVNPVDDIAYSILGSFYMALGDVSWIERQLAAIFLGNLPEGGYNESMEDQTRASFFNINLLVSENGFLRADLTHDGIHLNAQGYALWAPEIGRVLTKRKL